MTSPRGDSYEQTNRTFWDADADDYQAAHTAQIDHGPAAWGVWSIPESEVGAIGDIVGKDVLELGCGAAQWSLRLTEAGARCVGLDQSRAQLGHAQTKATGLALVCASATAVPLRDASFDVVFCDHGAMSFCDPYATVPEAARLLRPGGLLAFSLSTLLRLICYPPEDVDAPITKKLHASYFGARMFDWGDGTVDFQIPHGEWVRLFRSNGFEIEDLIELQAPEDAQSTYEDYVGKKWARRWPAEEIWKVRKR